MVFDYESNGAYDEPDELEFPPQFPAENPDQGVLPFDVTPVSAEEIIAKNYVEPTFEERLAQADEHFGNIGKEGGMTDAEFDEWMSKYLPEVFPKAA